MLYKLSRLDPSLSRLELTELCNIFGQKWQPDKKFEDREVTSGGAMFVWVAGLLGKRQPVPAIQKRLLLTHYALNIQRAGEAIAGEMILRPKELPVYVLSIADNTFAGFSRETEWLDLRTGDVVKDLPRPPVEVVSYNLTALYTALRGLYTKQGEKNAD